MSGAGEIGCIYWTYGKTQK